MPTTREQLEQDMYQLIQRIAENARLIRQADKARDDNILLRNKLADLVHEYDGLQPERELRAVR